MLKYIAKRILYIIFVFFIMSIIMFGIFKMVPGDPAAMAIKDVPKTDPVVYQQKYDAARERLGLDKPIPVQYVSWITKMLSGDFGYSESYRNDVINIVKEPMGNTIFINIFNVVAALLITIPLGIVQAVKKHSKFDNVVQVGTIVGYSLPSFIVSLVAIYFFAIKLQIFPVSGMNTPGFSGTGWEKFLDKMYHFALPLIVMTVASLGSMTRFVRAAMIEALSMDYIRTARAKGLTEKVVIYSHAFRNALLPIITLIIGWFLGIFGGSVVIEQIFGLNGLGKLLYTSLQAQDYNVVLALNMFYFVIAIVGNLITDLSYGLVDPRVKIN
ncbi:ABC transporter permease [Anaeromicropila herbilytica]|uniref:Peptide ABC transporter permease n=1 Tax=Anaeromicropila herbilytica TaxID=2785025 RepID=A0A7R7IDM3_9FIRM|nr:ABC transporter permease [Anaeromicropila herbilytica]BCN30173.1 peptide ABC transporter permease [Anaeromicropila herbilytica]